MKERPIIFNSAMVRAILDGRKTQTRRLVKQNLTQLGDGDWYAFDHKGINYRDRVNARHTTVSAWANLLQFCPYGLPSDRLWVRETFADEGARMCQEDCYYRADGECDLQGGRWTPSIHMPRWASRITLEVTAVRVERLQDISEEDAKNEGAESLICTGYPYHNPPKSFRLGFQRLWESINGTESWEQNPWVWVIEFKIVCLVF